MKVGNLSNHHLWNQKPRHEKFMEEKVEDGGWGKGYVYCLLGHTKTTNKLWNNKPRESSGKKKESLKTSWMELL